MDRTLIEEKLESLRRCVRRIEAKRLERLCGMHVITDELARRLKGTVGFRNVAVHQYESVDWQIVYAITHDHLGEFKQFAQAVVVHLNR